MNLIGRMKTYPSNEIKESFVSIGFECLDRELFNPNKCYDPLGKSGVKYARCQTGWARCEKEKQVYDFKWLDDIVDNLLKRGVLPWFNVGYGNPIYMPDAPNSTAVGCVPMLYGNETEKAWENYVYELAMHFKDRITHFEIWNEPDGYHFWFPEKPNAAKYAKFVSITGNIIRKAVPNAKIGACVSNFVFDYIDEFAKNTDSKDLDFFCYHSYSMIPENNLIENVHHIKRIFEKYGLNNVELWQGEAGYPSWFPKNHWLLPKGEGSEHQQAVWQLRRYFLDAAAGAKRSSFFQMADMLERPYEKAVDVINKPACHGILNGLTYTPKKSYETISRLATFFSGDIHPIDCYFTGSLKGEAIETVSKICLAFEKDGNPLYAYYLPTDIEAELPKREGFKVYIGNTDIKKPICNPVLIDMYTGQIYAIDNAVTDNEQMIIENLPISEYPMVLCDRSVFEIE